VLGVLLAANLVAALAVFRPWGGSPEELQRRLVEMQQEARQKEETLERMRLLVQTVERTRDEAGQFLRSYFLDRRTAYSTILSELQSLAEGAGIRAKDHSFEPLPIEGSEQHGMLNINGYYEGTYADLVQFVNLVDRSPRFLTIESLQATPQQAQGTLNVSLKLNVFVREESTAE
jgi:Tfp pilus assembly protein PilO